MPTGIYPRKTLAERVEKYIERIPFTTCWLWTGSLNGQGYGKIMIHRKTKVASRVVYELIKGLIPMGLTLDHLCRNRWCVNPTHLEAVSLRINLMRGNNLAMQNAQKKFCVRGHLLEGSNVYYPHRIGRRSERTCKACMSLRTKQFNQKGKSL